MGLWVSPIDGGGEDPINAENSGNTTERASRCLTFRTFESRNIQSYVLLVLVCEIFIMIPL